VSIATLDWSAAPLGPGVRILRTHPCGLAALEKPAGVLSHPNGPADEARALLAARYDERVQCFTWKDAAGAEHRAWLLHRLDSATSGVVLLANRERVADAVRAGSCTSATSPWYSGIRANDAPNGAMRSKCTARARLCGPRHAAAHPRKPR
jgi:hypothetical protein